MISKKYAYANCMLQGQHGEKTLVKQYTTSHSISKILTQQDLIEMAVAR